MPEFEATYMIVVDCDVCNGRGRVGVSSYAWAVDEGGDIIELIECDECLGTGSVPIDVIEVIE